MSLGSFARGAGRVFSPFLGTMMGGSDPSRESAPYLQAIPQEGRNAYNPFIQQGQQAEQQLGGEYNALLQNRPDYSQMGNDPLGYLNQLQSQYQPSEGYQYRKGQLQKEAAANAAAGGFRGTQGDTQNQNEFINRLMGEDMQQFLSNVFGIHERGQQGMERQHGAGLAGLERRANQGFQGAGNLADYLGSNLGQQGAYAYHGQAQRNANRQGLFNAAIGAAAGGAGFGAGSGGGGGGGFNPLSSANFMGGGSDNSTRGGYGAPGGGQYGRS